MADLAGRGSFSDAGTIAHSRCASPETENGADNTICYLNTDLDLTSAEDLTTLVAAFEAGGVTPLHVTHGADGLWYATPLGRSRRVAADHALPGSEASHT